MANHARSTPGIPEFYSGRSVFITGATGFMGKVLIERLLATVPDIGRIYLLVRTKKDVDPQKRLQDLKQSQVFDVLRANNPSQLDKLVVVPGDTTKPQLGMSQDSITRLCEVSVIFHSAATLKFDEALKVAVDQNIRSVIRCMELCDQLPYVEVFVHVSTAYSNPERKRVEEIVYKPPADVNTLLALVDAAPEDLLAEITPKFISPKPNTYTFTKAVAEAVVSQHKRLGYSAAIFRPSIVISAHKNPMPGWIENLNGPCGAIVGAGKGLLHVLTHDRNSRADMLPVDIAIDTLIATAWETALDQPSEVKVYNCSTYDNPIYWRDFEDNLRKYLRKNPLDNAFWYPSAILVNNQFSLKVFQFLLQTLPLHTAEYSMRFLGLKPNLSLIRANQKLKAMNSALSFFSLRSWKFETNNMKLLNNRLSEKDKAVFCLDTKCINWSTQLENFVMGARKYILKEKDEDLDKARRHIKRMSFLHHGLLIVGFLLTFRLLVHVAHGMLKFLKLIIVNK